MQLKLTRHFQDMMFARNIEIEHVKQAILHPDNKEDTYENKIKVTKKITGKTIEVIYHKEGFRDKSNEYLVITAYYL